MNARHDFHVGLQRPPGQIRREARGGHADHRVGVCGDGRRRRPLWIETDLRVHDLEFQHAGASYIAIYSRAPSYVEYVDGWIGTHVFYFLGNK